MTLLEGGTYLIFPLVKLILGPPFLIIIAQSLMPQFRETLSGLPVPGVQIVERGGRWGTSELNCTPPENGEKKRGGARAPFPL